ncbi:MAG: hypothetical protein HC796_00355 [Synechococcaceae cyanobacterium RL_1_2]|nr:hypothetical protein [Synechococcaceae cyanobacterium RL_1_2]
MRPQTAIKLLTFLTMIFIALGDKVIPGPVGKASFTMREGINNFVTGLIPDKKFRNPNERTEKAIEEEQKKLNQTE